MPTTITTLHSQVQTSLVVLATNTNDLPDSINALHSRFQTALVVLPSNTNDLPTTITALHSQVRAALVVLATNTNYLPTTITALYSQVRTAPVVLATNTNYVPTTITSLHSQVRTASLKSVQSLSLPQAPKIYPQRCPSVLSQCSPCPCHKHQNFTHNAVLQSQVSAVLALATSTKELPTMLSFSLKSVQFLSLPQAPKNYP